jgi:hypothetical protein
MGHYGDVVWGAKIEERFLTDELKRGARAPRDGAEGQVFQGWR